jgi:P-type Ca2+ transporter type 2C
MGAINGIPEPHKAGAADLTGLSEAEASARLAAEGPNALPARRHRSTLQLVRDVLREPMLILLLAAGVVYLVLGDLPEALMLLAFACFSVVITIFQEGRTDRAIEALGALATPLVTVIRDSRRHQISAAEIVRGDLVVIGEGDRIAADGWLIDADNLQTDEAVLTGESVPVTKRAVLAEEASAGPPAPGGDGLPYAFSGTLNVRGSGIVRVSATGARTRIGAIGQSLTEISTEAPRLAIETRKLVRLFALVGVAVSVSAGVLYGLLRGGWLDALLAGIALSMSLLPEELPVVLTLFLTMGALRLSRSRVLARRGAAIESLGAATVLCTDKTGTLTQNRMSIAELRLPDGRKFVPGTAASVLLPQEFVDLAGLGVLASLEQPLDPMESAFHDLAARHGEDEVKWRQGSGWTLHQQYPLQPELLAMSHVWVGDGAERIIAAKGAPEAIAELCAMTPHQRAALERQAEQMASEGLRVLGIAEARWSGEQLPPSQTHFDYVFAGLAGLADPIRPSVPPAIGDLQRAGVKVVMITGDYPLTARAIARQAGISEASVMTGAELAALDDEQLAQRVAEVSVFARIMADQKLRIVDALKARGEIVAMIGDGVNDAPSLKAAHIGVAMGKRGTEVAREAAAIVLLDDDFAAIPAAVRLGRRIYDNLRKAMAFIFAVHVPIAGLALSPLVLGWPIVLGPMHIASLEMIIDPVCALVFEAEREEPDVMRRPPRDPNGSLVPGKLFTWAMVQGIATLAILLTLTSWAFNHHLFAAEQGRAVAFLALVMAVLILVSVNRSFAGNRMLPRMRRNVPLVVIGAGAAVFIALVFGIPTLSSAFGVGPVPAEGLAAVALSSLALALFLLILRRRFGAALAA